MRPAGDAVTLKLDLIGAPCQIVPERSLAYTFGLQATPVKPITEDGWDHRIFYVSQGAFGARFDIPDSALAQLAPAGVRTIAFHEHWTDWVAYPGTTYGAEVKKLAVACRKHKINLLLYLVSLLSNLAPEWPAFSDECVAYATSYWDGETLAGESGAMQDVLPLDSFRAQYMGHPWGVPAELLCYGRPFTYEQAAGVALLHDVPIRATLGPNLQLLSSLWKLFDQFDRKHAQWVPYWRGSECVAVEPAGACASLYAHPTNGALVVLASLAHAELRIKARLDLAKLKLDERVVIADALTGPPIPIAAGTIELALPPLGWRVLWVKPARRKPATTPATAPNAGDTSPHRERTKTPR